MDRKGSGAGTTRHPVRVPSDSVDDKRGSWFSSVVSNLTPSIISGMWTARNDTFSSGDAANHTQATGNGGPRCWQNAQPGNTAVGPNAMELTDDDTDEEGGARNVLTRSTLDSVRKQTTTSANMRASSEMASGSGLSSNLRKMDEMVSRCERVPNSSAKRLDPTVFSSSSRDRTIFSRIHTIPSSSSSSGTTSDRKRAAPDMMTIEEAPSHVPSRMMRSEQHHQGYTAFQPTIAKRPRRESESSYAAFGIPPGVGVHPLSSQSMFLDRSGLLDGSVSGRVSRMSERPPSAMTSASLRSRIGASSIGSPLRSSLSSRTRRMLNQLERISTPVNDANKATVVNPWQSEQWSVGGSNPFQPVSSAASFHAGRLRGPPLASLSSPTRAQLLNRSVASIGSKPYWRRPGATSARPSQTPKLSSTVEKGAPMVKGVDGRRTNVFSALDDDLKWDTPAPSTSNAPILQSANAPPTGFLGIEDVDTKFSFSAPTAKLPPTVVRSGETTKPTVVPALPPVCSASGVVSPPLPKCSESLSASSFVPPQLASSKPWCCKECFVSNSFELDRCACCGAKHSTGQTSQTASVSVIGTNQSTSRSGSSSRSQVPSPTVVQSTDASFKSTTFDSSDKTTSSGQPIASTSGAVAAAEQQKKKWQCPTCFVANDDDCVQCPCCSTRRPGGGGATPTTTATTEKQAKEQKKGWSCSQCFVSNSADADSCACCGSRCDGKSGAGAAPTLNSFGLPGKKIVENGEADVLVKKDWSCGTCFVLNGADRQLCLACQTPKPGNTYKAVSFGVSLPSSVSNIKGTPAPAGLLFGQLNNSTAPSTGSDKKSVKFAEPLSTTHALTPVTPFPSLTTPTFGSGSSNATPTPVFGFGTPSADTTASTTTVAESAKPAATNFMPPFGTSSTSGDEKAATVSTDAKKVDGSAPSAVPASAMFGQQPSAATTAPTPASAGTATTFSTPSSSTTTTTTTAAVAPFSFGQSKPASTTTAPSFLPSPKGGFLFGNTSLAASSASASATTTTATTTTGAPVFAFGATTTAATAKSTPPTSGSIPAPSLGWSSNAAPTGAATGSFGAVANATATPVPIAFNFGGAAATTSATTVASSTSSTTAAAAPVFQFGTSSGSGTTNSMGAQQPKTDTTSLFGGSAAPSTGFNFGGGAVPSKFAFGQQQQPQRPTASFNFGATTTAPPATFQSAAGANPFMPAAPAASTGSAQRKIIHPRRKLPTRR